MGNPVLTGVTLTGADDSVHPRKLIELSQEFPFVEWGILVGSRAGHTRFPSPEWRRDLAALVHDTPFPVKLSLHICGQHLAGIKDAGLGIGNEVLCGLPAQRAQLNFHGVALSEREETNIIAVVSSPVWFALETIVQLDGVNDDLLDRLLSRGIPASGLYDESHGGGVTPGVWPMPRRSWEVGYAGGLGPENVAREVRNIADVTANQRFWIDMETKLFTQGHFNVRSCRTVLEEMSRFFPVSAA